MDKSTRQAVGAAAFLASALIVSLTWQQEGKFFSSTMASWAQAIGTVGAVWTAILAIDARRQEIVNEQSRLLSNALLAVSQGCAAIESVSGAFEDKDRLAGLEKLGVEKLLDMPMRELRAFPTASLEAEVGHQIRLMEQALISTVVLAPAIEGYASKGDAPQEFKDFLKSRCNRATEIRAAVATLVRNNERR
jgi:hypothetical protein